MDTPTPRRQRGTGAVIRRGEMWHIKYSYKGTQVWESSHSKVKSDAEKLLRRRLAEVTLSDKPFTRAKITVKDLVTLVLADYNLLKKRSTNIVEYRAEKHVIPLLGSLKAEMFGSVHVKEYIEARRNQAASDSTINRELSIIRRGFHLGHDHEPPLVSRLPRIPKLEEDNVRQGFLEPNVYRKLRDALPVHLRCLLVVGYYLGLRLGTLRRMKWEQVDFGSSTIRIPKSQTKQNKAQTVPIYGEMRAWLEIQYADSVTNWPECPYVFHRGDFPIGSHVEGWNDACDVAGIPRVLRHDLRRTAVRNMERAGIPRSVAMSITGHKTESTYRRYDIVNEADLKRAGRKMEQFFEDGSKTVAGADVEMQRKDVN
jgi:integrase